MNKTLHSKKKQKRFSRKTKKRSHGKSRVKGRGRGRGRGGGEKLGVIVYESPTRPKFPVSKVVYIDDDRLGSTQKFGRTLSDSFYDAEDYLYALKENQKGKKLPNKFVFHSIDIEKPTYIAPI